MLRNKKTVKKVTVIAHNGLIYVKKAAVFRKNTCTTIARNEKSLYLCIVKRLIDCLG